MSETGLWEEGPSNSSERLRSPDSMPGTLHSAFNALFFLRLKAILTGVRGYRLPILQMGKLRRRAEVTIICDGAQV